MSNDSRKEIGEIISVYDNKIVKAYSWGRFRILHQRFLDEIGQYLPREGRVLDIGCGFGLFSCYYARKFPGIEIIGIDMNPVRIEMAAHAARRLSLPNARFEMGEVTSCDFPGSGFDCAYMLDIVHHIPRQTVSPLIRKLHETLSHGCRLIIKDVDVKPVYKRWFTYTLDKVMDFRTQVSYWPSEELVSLLRAAKFEVFLHAMVDFLPYPHVLYICKK